MRESGSAFYSGWVFKLILANVIFFVIQVFTAEYSVMYSFNGMETRGPSLLTFYLGLTPAMIIENGYIWQPVTYMFLHSTYSFAHLFFNMYALLIFGVPVEQQWGSKKFLQYYFFCGTFAGLSIFLINLVSGGAGYVLPTIGASGAVFGLLLAFGILYPDMEILLFFVLPIKAKYLVILYGCLELFFELSGGQGAVSHIGHLGGLFAGLLYFLYFKRKNISFKSKIARAKNEKRLSEHNEILHERSRKMDDQGRESMISILKKTKESGFDSLTDDEVQYVKHLEIMNDSADTNPDLCSADNYHTEDDHCIKCEHNTACFLREMKKYM